jgi:hypothetical protein
MDNRTDSGVSRAASKTMKPLSLEQVSIYLEARALIEDTPRQSSQNADLPDQFEPVQRGEVLQVVVQSLRGLARRLMRGGTKKKAERA